MKDCKICSETKPFTEFYKNKRNKTDGHGPYCKTCQNKYTSERRKGHPRSDTRSESGFSSNRLLRGVKVRANRKGLDFNLDREWINSELNTSCPVTGKPFYLGKVKYHPLAPSIDKINPLKGYTKDNCRVVCYWYNTAKLNYTDEQVLDLCKSVVTKQQGE